MSVDSGPACRPSHLRTHLHRLGPRAVREGLRLRRPPFRWDEDRRFLLRAELDAAFFHLYLPSDSNGDWVPARKADGCPYDETPEQLAELKKSFPKPRDAVSYIMDTFPIVKRKDEEQYGSYRTKVTILSIYDEMQEAVRTGKPYQTRLSPEPGSRECCHEPGSKIPQ